MSLQFLKSKTHFYKLFLIVSFITFLDNLENAVTFAKLGTLHTSIILVSQLEQTFLNLSTIYVEVLLFKNFENYYQVNFVKDKIIFAINCQFLKHIFEIFHFYPIPLITQYLSRLLPTLYWAPTFNNIKIQSVQLLMYFVKIT